MTKPIERAKVLIVDDHPAVREALAMRIANCKDLEVCGEADDLAAALTQIEATHPDVAVIDISLKTGNGIDLIKRIKSRNHAVRILVWSMYEESLYAERALHAGAMGYLSKQHATSEIVTAIRRILEGKVYVSEAVSDRLLTLRVGNQRNPDSGPCADLSDRELEVFELIGNGLSTREIAERLHVSIKTIETHRQRIKRKLTIATNAELIRAAAQWVLEHG